MVLVAAAPAMAQRDPGPRAGAPGAGGPLAGLSSDALAFFNAARNRFQEVNSVSGTIEAGNGLGPRFNGNSCAMCHVQPAIGGTSPAGNPQVPLATTDGARNIVPSFVMPKGPVREARFKSDGGVHDLYVITGRRDAPGCNIGQPDFEAELDRDNVSFRIPTPVFGLGLVEDVPDDILVANAMREAKFNRSGNDGTITKFGWKAQNKSLQIFAAEAYNVEQGVTNPGFPNERETDPHCQFNATPEDTINITVTNPSASRTSDGLSDSENFAEFIRLLAPPTPAPDTASTVRGRATFAAVGCASCHVQKQTTHGGVGFFPYSDFALHDMGKELADGILQGNAAGNEFRTAPLWGAGQRLFFLHDGRTTDLLQAILAHDGEAKKVAEAFQDLSKDQQQDLLNFLRGL
jgi:CxxC motif-containing protein (DUF1111 family)